MIAPLPRITLIAALTLAHVAHAGSDASHICSNVENDLSAYEMKLSASGWRNQTKQEIEPATLQALTIANLPAYFRGDVPKSTARNHYALAEGSAKAALKKPDIDTVKTRFFTRQNARGVDVLYLTWLKRSNETRITCRIGLSDTPHVSERPFVTQPSGTAEAGTSKAHFHVASAFFEGVTPFPVTLSDIFEISALHRSGSAE